MIGSLSVIPVAAQGQTIGASASPRPKASLLSARPAHMPCRIVERYGPAGSSPKIDTIYTLKYRKDGLLEKATHRYIDNDCNTLSACHYSGEAVLDMEYRYDDQGHLIEAAAPAKGERLSVTYEGGRPYRYHHVREQDQMPVAEREVTVTIDGAGRPAASIERAWIAIPGGRGRMTTTSRFSGVQEPFASEPAVWPFTPDRLFVGWSRRTSTITTLGTRDRTPVYENEIVTYDEQGRIRRAVLTIDYQGRTVFVRDFVYDCPGERSAEKLDSSG